MGSIEIIHLDISLGELVDLALALAVRPFALADLAWVVRALALVVQPLA